MLMPWHADADADADDGGSDDADVDADAADGGGAEEASEEGRRRAGQKLKKIKYFRTTAIHN